jgi:NAD(P)-dependent dehydrogenase (short-subunit alcohol dehydrogenase family)
VLINNAGVIRSERITTADGLETTFAVNHLAYFLLTNLLLDRLKARRPVQDRQRRFGGPQQRDHRLRRPPGREGVQGAKAYSQSKLANVLFTYELARRLEGTGVTANCCTPGWSGPTSGAGFLGPSGSW